MTENIKFTIDGTPITACENDTILTAAEKNGIEIPTLCYYKDLSPYGACGMCVVEVEGSPKLVRACSAKVKDAMSVNTKSEKVLKARRLALELLMGDHLGDCIGRCSLNCPAHTDCQKYVKEITNKDFESAVKTIKEVIALPASIGRICPHPCETACARQYVDEPISIAQLKSFAADEVLKSGKHVLPDIKKSSGKTVGIIGGGPAGLAAAYKLIQEGHFVTVYDQMPKMGGMLRYGIPEYRLPKSVLDIEIDELKSLGVNTVNNCTVGKDITLKQLREKHDAVLVANGAWKSMSTGCPGEDANGVFGGIDFLREAALGHALDIGKKTAIVGGGNTAMDACRTAVRLGAEEVNVIYRRTRDEMPAEDIEIEEAIEEGVTFRFLTNPDEIISENGKVKAIKLQVMKLGEKDKAGRRSPVKVDGEFIMLETDSVIMAIGQRNDPSGFEELTTTSKGTVLADERTFATNIPGVFAAGDTTNKGASIAISAIAEANEAAKYIDAYLNGIDIPYKKQTVSQKTLSEDMFTEYEKYPRVTMPKRVPDERRNDFGEVNLGFGVCEAVKEAKRCLECGCFDYGNCKLIKYANEYETDCKKYTGEYHKGFKENSLKVIIRDQNKCILCGMCVRICEKETNHSILGLVGRGFDTVIKPEFMNTDISKICSECKKCALVCPTGALKITD